jgi:formate hydrogenlyase subunit 3/multisubunit Na+/H+ antiporter MnhD subunit
MSIFRGSRKSKEWRQFVIWISATLVFPFTAYFGVVSITPELDFTSAPVILIFGFCWLVISFLIRRYVKDNIK